MLTGREFQFHIEEHEITDEHLVCYLQIYLKEFIKWNEVSACDRYIYTAFPPIFV